ncbi:RNA polymerase II [Blomia tropicalis]|nr:RNA polymerase II [Blomia tropicalis]
MSTNDMYTLLYDGSEKVVITKWRVTSEFMINQSPFVLFLYRSIDSSGLQRENELKYKVNKSGITVRRLYKKVGDTIEPGDVLLEYEPCSHSTLMKDLCALCGINIDKFDTSEKRKIAENTSVAMVHSIPELRVSKQVAEDLGRADEDRLLKAKKLVLLVDLDQTIIHSTNQDVPNDIEGIHHYQLCGPNSPWYHTKFRPFMTEFLEEISNYFELHICTFGVRRYAHQISNLIDPKCRFFPKDRILSRDEFFDPRSKTGNMKSLFPCGDSMVCIIDDRVDVWNYSPNVVHVKPYLCFKTEDINAPEKLLGFKSFEENVDQSATSPSSKPTANADTTDTSIDNKTESNDSTENKDSKSELKNEESSTEDDKKVDKEDIVKESTIKKEDILIDDTDDYLLYLKDILIRIHTEYYREYDEKKRYQCEGEEILIPDLKRIIPQVRKLVLHGVNIVFSGVIATNSTPDSNKYYRLAKSLGAMITNDVIVYGSPRTTHLIGSKWGTVKVNKCLKHPHIKMVTPEWLFTCAERWEKVDEALFQLKKDTEQSRTTGALAELPFKKVVVHPLVLLSVVDHFNRMGKIGNQKRVVGILLGSIKGKGLLDISNSFAVPFDEDERDKSVWFLDHDYLENMYAMFKKVNAKERIVGWYHTGPKLHQNDISINELIRKYCPHSVLVIIDAKPKDLGLPTEAYFAVEEVHDDGTPTSKTFEHLLSEIGAEEAEEVGVEHLLRDIKDTTFGSLSQLVTNQLLGLKGLNVQINAIKNYLEAVIDDKLPMNHTIIYLLQDIFNLLPDVANSNFINSTFIKTNDQMLVVYLASLVRSVIALHNLINNKIANRDAEKKESQGKDTTKKDSKETSDSKDKDKDSKDSEKKSA